MTVLPFNFSSFLFNTLLIVCVLSNQDLRGQFEKLLTKYHVGGRRGTHHSLSERTYRYKSFVKFAQTMSAINSDPRNTYKTELNLMSVLLPEEKKNYFGRNSSQFFSVRGKSKHKKFKIKAKNLKTKNFAKSRSWRGRNIFYM